MRDFTPLRDMILVRPDAEPEFIGSILVPKGWMAPGHQADNVHDDYRDTFTGTVVAVGRGDHKNEAGARHPMEVKVGDRVIFPRRPSSPEGTSMDSTGDCGTRIDGELYLIFHEEQNALAVIVED